ncbi:putative bifunctional diguanylate cyclase/phosphodiesterase [Macromonas nakdongensis]|uniref:putative bifunctional diguanylate cyclase/phosphodiesterase n=1 Tax=Macromonas nakdongensis TaxID=1843082 RepID=UPI000C326AD5|nr:EAL domain-containing protein [Macromonas nakdongensis]
MNLPRPSAAADWDLSAEEALHRRRVRRMLLTGGTVMVLASLWWGSYFAAQRWWGMVASDVLICAAGLAVVVLAWRQRLRASSLLILPVVVLVLVLQSLLLDVPTLAAPRSVHLYLLPLGVFALVAFRHEKPWLARGAPLLCLALFLGFSATQAGLDSPFQLPDALRVWGTWVNALLAVSTLFVMLHILQTDASPLTARQIELRKAIERGQMVLHYQPQVDAERGVVGAEALVRWRHPARGLVMPGDFIPLAERTGLILPLGDWVLDEACRQLAQWGRDPVLAPLVLSVNVSAAQLHQADFVPRVIDGLRAAAVAPERLRLELTESVLVQDLQTIADKMAALKTHGVTLSLDDFGTGFSSLSYLKRLPLDELKIDQSFVQDLLEVESDATIVDSMLALGRSLGLKVIAEGVETEAQWRYLRDHGCHLFQGYWFSPPLPQEAFEAWVRQPKAPLADGDRPQAASAG